MRFLVPTNNCAWKRVFPLGDQQLRRLEAKGCIFQNVSRSRVAAPLRAGLRSSLTST